VTDTWNYHALLDRLAGRGIERFTLVVSPAEDRILRDPAARVLRVTPVVHPRMGYFDLLFCECERVRGAP